MIESFVEAFNCGESEAVLALLSASALFELPLLGQRLVGHPEIRAGLARIRDVTVICRLELTALGRAPGVSIGEGSLRARRRADSATLELPMAMVATGTGGGIERLSVYLNTRGQRLWSDSAILPSVIHG